MQNVKSITRLPIMVTLIMASGIISAQALETETARPLLPGQFEIGAGLEYQASSEGTETALPLAIEYGISNRFTVLVEPVAFTNISPNEGTGVTGFGDLEITLFYNFVKEGKYMPALTLSGEVKLPTANSALIGTGKTDYAPYLIASKKIGNLDLSANLSYTIIGKPDGIALELHNTLGYALGGVYTIKQKWILFGEIYGNTSALGSEGPEGTDIITGLTSEISGGETVGALGFGYYPKPNFLLSLGINYDNNNAILIRPGIEWKFGGEK